MAASASGREKAKARLPWVSRIRKRGGMEAAGLHQLNECPVFCARASGRSAEGGGPGIGLHGLCAPTAVWGFLTGLCVSIKAGVHFFVFIL